MTKYQSKEPEQEEKERQDDQIDQQREDEQIDQHRNERVPIDVRSEKGKGKAPMSSSDPSADKVFDEDPLKVAKLRLNYSRGSPPVGSSLDKESPKDSVRFVSKDSTSSPTVVGSYSRSKNGESHKSRGFGHVLSHNTTSCAERASWGNNEEPEVPGLLQSRDFLSPWRRVNEKPGIPGLLQTIESLSSAVRASQVNNEEPEVPAILESSDILSKTNLKIHRIGLKTGKEMDVKVPGPSKKNDNSSIKKRKWVLRRVNREDMLSSLKELPQLQMDAICALYRQDIKTHNQITIRLSDSHRAKVKFIAEFLTCGNVLGPCMKTYEELEESFKGSIAFCSCILSIYSSELYDIYYGGLDLYFC